MADLVEGISGGSSGLPIASLPKTALQAIYHAVTGKTENLSKVIEGNVIIKLDDVDRLYQMILDQISLHPKMFDPTVTVVIKQANDKTVTYSSWARFKALRVSNHELTSEVTLKVEFVLQLPETATPQRCIVNVNLDSALPVVMNQRSEMDDSDPFGFFFVFRRKWRTAKISIDFVDFLVAKSFVALVEEWFQGLTRVPPKPANDFLLRNINTLRVSIGQMGRVGIGSFLAAYVWLSRGPLSLARVTVGVAIAFFLWAFLEAVESSVSRKLLKRISANVIPSVILLSDKDQTTYTDIAKKTNSPAVTLANVAFSILGAILLNVVASYIYTYLTQSQPK